MNLAKLNMTQKLNYGEIWLANLNPGKGTEPGKTRPVLIVQTQNLLDIEHPSTLIVPMTTHLIDDAEPLRLRIKKQKKLKQDSDLLLDQIRAIDNKRFTEGPLAQLDSKFMQQVITAINELII